MFEIVNKQVLANQVKRLDIKAPRISKNVKSGQFVMITPLEGDEGIPISVAETNVQKETITLIFKEVGYTTKRLGSLSIAQSINTIVGPLGIPSSILEKKTILCIATGVGIAQIYPIARAYQKSGSKVIGIIGAKTKRELLLETQMRLVCDKILIATEDGSYERKGLATDLFKKHIGEKKIDLVYAIGANAMMCSVCEITKLRKIKTLVHLNPVMSDCIGVCGSCRVKVNGKTLLACVEGPEFDGHKVDFNDLIIRMDAYKEYERCHSPLSDFNRAKNDQNRLAKFLSGILKK